MVTRHGETGRFAFIALNKHHRQAAAINRSTK
jgi:hypothetical protein